MLKTTSTSRIGPSVRFCLTARGHSTGFAYRAQVHASRGPKRRTAFELARTEWASSHGLELDDGVYLCELAEGAMTTRQLGEALAICSQSREMVKRVVARLVEEGFLERLGHGETRPESPSLDSVRLELAMARVELDCIRPSFDIDDLKDRRMVAPSLRQAVFRFIAASRLLESLSPATKSAREIETTTMRP